MKTPERKELIKAGSLTIIGGAAGYGTAVATGSTAIGILGVGVGTAIVWPAVVGGSIVGLAFYGFLRIFK